MDWTNVALGVIGIAGTLGGISLGQWLQLRHRHDAEKRRVYGAYLTEMRLAVDSIEDLKARVDAKDWYRTMITLATDLRLIGAGRVVRVSLKLDRAMNAWMVEPDNPANRQAVVAGVSDLMIAMRRDLGSGGL